MATNTGKTDTPETAANVLASPAAVDDKKVEVELANFLPARSAVAFGLSDKEYKPGEKIKIHRDEAASLITQGAVAVDPTDNKAVAKILGL